MPERHYLRRRRENLKKVPWHLRTRTREKNRRHPAERDFLVKMWTRMEPIEPELFPLPGDKPRTGRDIREERIARKATKVVLEAQQKRKQRLRPSKYADKIAPLIKWNQACFARIITEVGAAIMKGWRSSEEFYDTTGIDPVRVVIGCARVHISKLNWKIKRKPETWVRVKRELLQRVNERIADLLQCGHFRVECGHRASADFA